jgi:hypothetical protein
LAIALRSFSLMPMSITVLFDFVAMVQSPLINEHHRIIMRK